MNLLPDSLPGPADRTVAKHRDEIRNVLVHLFENPIPDTETHAGEMLSSVLGKPDLGFAKPIIDLVDNPQLSPLVQAGVSPCVWEDKLLCDKGSRSVLTITSAATKGQELLFDFLGNYTYNVYTQYVQRILWLYFVHTLYVDCLFSKSLICAENVCLIDGKMQVSPPIISQSQELVHHNLLPAHLFVALTQAPAMQRC